MYVLLKTVLCYDYIYAYVVQRGTIHILGVIKDSKPSAKTICILYFVMLNYRILTPSGMLLREVPGACLHVHVGLKI